MPAAYITAPTSQKNLIMTQIHSSLAGIISRVSKVHELAAQDMYVVVVFSKATNDLLVCARSTVALRLKLSCGPFRFAASP